MGIQKSCGRAQRMLAVVLASSGFAPATRLATPMAPIRATCPKVPNVFMTSWNDGSVPVTYNTRPSEFSFSPESQTEIEGRYGRYGPYNDGYRAACRVRAHTWRAHAMSCVREV